MKRLHTRIITFLFLFFLLFDCIGWNQAKVYAVNEDDYLVLIQQEDGTWNGYEDCIEVSGSNQLMIKAKKISKELGFTYKKKKDGIFVIKKSASTYNIYTQKTNKYTYTKGKKTIEKKAAYPAYLSEVSSYNMCTIGSLRTLVYCKCFDSTQAREYSDYAGVVCISRYHKIPETVPIAKIVPTKAPTPTPKPETSINIEGVEFPVRTKFLTKESTLSDWGGTATLWDKLSLEVNGKILPSTILSYSSKKIEFSHQGLGFDGVTLSKTTNGYKISISVKLDGSVTADQSASIVKAMVTTISSKPSVVYEAIYDSFTSTKTHGINRKTYTTIGDCKIKSSIQSGVVTYYINASK